MLSALIWLWQVHHGKVMSLNDILLLPVLRCFHEGAVRCEGCDFRARSQSGVLAVTCSQTCLHTHVAIASLLKEKQLLGCCHLTEPASLGSPGDADVQTLGGTHTPASRARDSELGASSSTRHVSKGMHPGPEDLEASVCNLKILSFEFEGNGPDEHISSDLVW